MCQFSLKFPFYDSLKTVDFKWKKTNIYFRILILFTLIQINRRFRWELLSLIYNDSICTYYYIS